MKGTKTIVSILALSLGLSVGVGSYAFAAEHRNNAVYMDKEMTQELIPVIQKDYKLNSKGKTYGTGAAATYIEELPDLVRVIGDDGKEGYVYVDEWVGEAPSSPEEALAIQEKRESAGDTSTVINVYDCEGETVIDTLTKHSDIVIN